MSCRYPPNPALPPFPTRRSSDLLLGRVLLKLHRNFERHFFRIPVIDEADVIGKMTARLVRSQLCKPVDGADEWRVRDRKSTRLNSSHEKISYAVFCLKKKHSGQG